MSAYSAAMRIDRDSPSHRFSVASSLLADAGSVVLLERCVALRNDGHSLACEVIDPAPGAHRCEVEFEVLVENARLLLEASPLRLPGLPRSWRVVDDTGSRTVELWRAPR